MASLAGKIAVITGGSRGIGNAIARRFADEGATCILIGRSLKTIKPASENLSEVTLSAPGAEPLNAHHRFIVGSVSQEATWQNIVKENPKIDILVNAAGVSQGSLLTKTSFEEVAGIFDNNLLSATFGCKAVSKVMIKNRSGCIINVSSVLATKGGTGASVYAASKAGMLGLTSALSQELGHFQVRVNALVPGYIKTKMTERLNEEDLNKQIPLGRMGTADEVADAAAFLAKNPYANNCVLTIDGGLSAA